MGDFIIYISIGIIAFWAGWHLRSAVILAHMAENPERMIQILQEIQKINDKEKELDTQINDGTELEIERVGNVLYAYAKETGQFIAQGASMGDLLDEAKRRFPSRKFFGNIAKDNPAKELV